MTTEKFNEIVEDRKKLISFILQNKAKEYASDMDCLQNFKDAARILNSTPKKALWGMAIKHIVCVQDMVNSEKKYFEPYINEKIGDTICYLILLEALLKEK